MTGAILVFNAGASSLKLAVYHRQPEGELAIAYRGDVELSENEQRFSAIDTSGNALFNERWTLEDPHHESVLEHVLDAIEKWLGDGPLAIGHRLAHGGARFFEPEVVTPDLLNALHELDPLPSPNEASALSLMKTIAAIRKDVTQVVCFDTGFHQTIPLVAQRYGLPREFHEAGVRHYGAHGLSHAFITQRLREIAPEVVKKRVIVAHLGDGGSLCAIKNGASIETTTGFSPLDGLLMGTRCGPLDPGVLLYMLKQGRSIEALEDVLYRQSGLLGVSGGVSSDIRVLLASDDPRAKEAIDLFVYKVVREIGAMVSALGGLDTLVFTGSIGEREPVIRERICTALRWLGVDIDSMANEKDEPLISEPTSRFPVRIIPTDEEWMIASCTLAKLG